MERKKKNHTQVPKDIFFFEKLEKKNHSRGEKKKIASEPKFLPPWKSNDASLKNLKLLSFRVKELFELIVLRKEADGFLLYLKTFSWETDLWVAR